MIIFTDINAESIGISQLTLWFLLQDAEGMQERSQIVWSVGALGVTITIGDCEYGGLELKMVCNHRIKVKLATVVEGSLFNRCREGRYSHTLAAH